MPSPSHSWLVKLPRGGDRVVSAGNWVVALGLALDGHEAADRIHRLVLEASESGGRALDLERGQRFQVQLAS